MYDGQKAPTPPLPRKQGREGPAPQAREGGGRASVGAALEHAACALMKAGIDAPRWRARALLAAALDLTSAEISAHPERRLNPAQLVRVTARGVPANAILASSVVGFLSVIAAAVSPDTIFEFLLNSSGAIILFVYLLVSAWSNAVNLTDGLDGLAAGSMSLVLGAYVIITFWQYRNSCVAEPGKGCYDVRDPLDLALLCAAGAAACIGFLWWNAAPAKIFMGDTGSLALGGMLAGLSVTTRTELLMVVIGALFVAEAASVVIQVAVFRSSRRRGRLGS